VPVAGAHGGSPFPATQGAGAPASAAAEACLRLELG